MKVFARTLSKRVINYSFAFIVAFSSLTAVMPFAFSKEASAVAPTATVYDALPSVDPQTNYDSVGFQATSTSEFGDLVHLAGTNRIADDVTVTLSSWAKFSEWSSNPTYSGNSTSFSYPITLNIYDANALSGGTAVTPIATKTQTFDILYRPEVFPKNGLAQNVIFDLSSLHVTLPSDIVIGVAYNTQTRGYAPTGVAGPYNSLNVAVPADQTIATGTDDNTDELFWNSTYGGRAAGFRTDTDWAPNGTVAFKLTATPANTAPSLSFLSPTPADNAFVSGVVNGKVSAEDDYGMGSYYVRFWKNAFESGSSNLLQSCYSAPGAYNLGTSVVADCAFDVAGLDDGTKVVLSAQFLDGDNQWASAQRTFTVDNTKPTITIKTGVSANEGSTGTGPYSQVSFKLYDANGNLKEVELNGHKYARGGMWNDFNWVNITKSQLIEGENTIIVRDKAGNESTLIFVYDKTAPTAEINFPAIGSSAISFNVVYNEAVNPIDAANAANYFLSNWPGAGGSGDLAGDAIVVYNPANFTATVTFTNTDWYVSAEQQWGVENVRDLAGNTITPNPTTAYSSENLAPLAPSDVTATSPANDLSIDWTWTAAEDDTTQAASGVAYYQYALVADGDTPSLWTNTAATSATTDVSADGNYQLYVRAVDNAGNIGDSAVGEVTIDATDPVVTVTGGDISVEAGTAYDEQGATWTDNVDGNGNVDNADITGAVNTAVPGVYTVSYSYTDAAGNTGTADRTVTVVDTTPAVITLVGDAAITLDEGDSYTDQGATWTDVVDGTGAAVVTGAVDTSTPGVYVLAYNYTDAAGNPAVEVTRTVTVVAVEDTDTTNNEGNGDGDDEEDNQVVFQDINNEGPATDDSDVQGDNSDTGSSSTDSDSDVQGDADKNTNAGTFLGLAWYWWLLIVAAAGVILWWIIGALRNRTQQDQ